MLRLLYYLRENKAGNLMRMNHKSQKNINTLPLHFHTIGVFTLVKVYWTTVDLKAAFRMSEDEEKVKLRRIEPAIQKFIKVAIPTDLERLRKHQINIEKRCRLWDRLHEEHINAGRTVQQLRANMREMEKLCLRVRQEDIPVLWRMINPIKEEASTAIKDFLQLHSESAEELKRQLKEQEDASLTRSATLGQETLYNMEVKDGSQSLIQIYSHLPEIPQEENAAESWESLEGDLIELSQLSLSDADHGAPLRLPGADESCCGALITGIKMSQQEKIDRIEDHVNSAAANVEEGTKNLGKAAKYKLAALPVAGAVIGGVVGGPIGLLAGFKVAGVAAALGGGILGFTGRNEARASLQLWVLCLCPDRQAAGSRDSTGFLFPWPSRLPMASAWPTPQSLALISALPPDDLNSGQQEAALNRLTALLSLPHPTDEQEMDPPETSIRDTN
ncbi:hypothetical protein IHE44_0000812 [Lamprotornis superbus]|uniref:t-SNARE coiled-coil homology domain-containing protein n=1 Tax=Lamprotornis superbus TaxID=245042 RepID=A0A835NP34_9PASS|nr:hypothetical protein IHE44_0000812 [Lamprotornis superbus]